MNDKLRSSFESGPTVLTCFIQRIKEDIEIGFAVGQESGFTRMFSDTLAYIQARVDRRHAVSHVFDYLIATEVGEIGFSSTGGTCSADLVVHIQSGTDNGRIADTTRYFEGHSAGCGDRCEISILVHGTHMDCARFPMGSVLPYISGNLIVGR